MDIVEELRQNRESGARRLETEYKAGLMSLARRFCQDSGDAEELVNRTFAAVVEGIDDYLEQSAFFAWMCQILTNIHTMDVRRKSNQNIIFPGVVPDAPDEEANEEIYRNLNHSLLRDAIQSLPKEMKEVIVMHYLMEESVPQVAKFLCQPVTTVKWRLHCARKALAAKMGVKMHEMAEKPGGKAVILALLLCGITALGAAAWNLAVSGESRVASRMSSSASAEASQQATSDTRQAETGTLSFSTSSDLPQSPSVVAGSPQFGAEGGSGFNQGDNMNKTATTRAAAMLAAATLATPAMADWTWSGGNNADLADAANWTGSAGAYLFGASASGLYLSRDWTCPTNMHLTANGTTVSFDLGAARTLTFGEKAQYWFNANNSTVEFTSGKLVGAGTSSGNLDMVLLSSGDWGAKRHLNTFRLTGKDTAFSGYAIHCYNGDSNTLEVANGALFSASLRFGNTNPRYQRVFVHDGATMTNTSSQAGGTSGIGFQTTVDNATFVCSGNDLSVAGKEARFEFLNNSTGAVPGKQFLLGNGDSSVSNKLVVSGGSNLSASSLRVGVSESKWNEALVTGDGTFVDAQYGLYIGGLGTAGTGVSNAVTVADGAQVSVTQHSTGHQSLVVGYSGGGNLLAIESGGIVTNGASGTPYLGYASSDNRIVVDGGKLHSSRCLVLGNNGGANSNSLSVANGIFRGITYYCTFRVGGSGSFNLAEVGDDGLLELMMKNGWAGRNPGNGNDNSYVGFGNGASHNVLRVLAGGTVITPSAFGNSSFASGAKLNVGLDRNTCSNRFEVLGGTAKIGQIYIGGTNETSVGNAMVVSNGTVNASKVFVSQTDTLPPGVPFTAPNALEIAGTNSLVQTESDMRFYNKAELSLDFADGAYATVPLLANKGTLQFYTGSTIKVKNTKAVSRAGGAKVTVARRSAGAIALDSGLVDAWNAALSADNETFGCEFSLENDDKDLVLKIGGEIATILCFR